MIEPKKLNIDGMEFTIHPMPALRALKLDKRIITMLLPIISGFKKLDLDSDIDMGAIVSGISEGMNKLDEATYEKLVIDMLSNVQCIPPGGEACQLDSAGSIDRVFVGNLLTVYKLMFEVMRHNKFSPFALVGDGNGIKKILSSFGRTVKEKQTGKASEKLESLLET